MNRNCTNTLSPELQRSAEQLIEYIASGYVELSQDKIHWQRNNFIKICREWLKANRSDLATTPRETSDNF